MSLVDVLYLLALLTLIFRIVMLVREEEGDDGSALERAWAHGGILDSVRRARGEHTNVEILKIAWSSCAPLQLHVEIEIREVTSPNRWT
ncbi:hypothetical protein EDB19DRAFT_1694982 [Suillus lakei]|nr:hypothetical protein EDB19DRAFT_1694982 [Suillus lakei]